MGINDLIVSLMLYIASVSGGFSDELQYESQLDYKVHFGAPSVQFTTSEHLFMMKHQRAPSHNDAFAVEAIHFGSKIYLKNGWNINNPVDQSKLLHELVHYMQDNMFLDYTCLGDKERLAYYIQEKWLMEEQGFSQREFYDRLELNPLAMVAAMMCVDENSELAKPWQGGP